MLDNELDELLNDTAPVGGQKRKSLGRGLGALLGDDFLNEDAPTSEVKNIDNINVSDLVAGKYQPRSDFDDEALKNLSDSIKEKGVLQPLLVRKQGDKFEIIAGERRWRAAKMAGLSEVPVVIKELSDKDVLEAALVENILRENLSAIEEAEGFQRLIDEFSHTQDALAKIVGKSRSHISNTLRLLNLPQEVKDLISCGKLSAGHARALVGNENAVELAHQIISKDLSVRQVEDLVSKKKDISSKAEKVEKSSDLKDIEENLIKKLGFRIKINPNKQGGGKIVLQYSSIAELDMIIDTLEQKKRNETSQNAVFKSTEEHSSNEKFSIKLVD
ncbi:MAG: ParB/RepB/Spo0J family partition protein [Alphaproteobacteria bacterium]|nr:ParB/RepB/Spo0J family partition protein [Alphaproteobacteria bacterium]